MKSKLLLPLLLIGAVFVSNCAFLGTKKQAPPPEKHVSQEARKVLQQLRQVNASLKACKGLGDISIKRKSRRHQARMAWLAKVPDKIRLTLLGPGRRPLLTASADGEHLYYLNRSSKTRFLKKKMKQATLEDFFHIPVTCEQIVHLLSGRIPLIAYDTATVSKDKTDKNKLILKNHKDNQSEIVYLDSRSGWPTGFAVFTDITNNAEDLAFRAKFFGSRTINAYTVFKTIALSTGTGQTTVVLAISRYWPKDTIADEKFVLRKPENG